MRVYEKVMGWIDRVMYRKSCAICGAPIARSQRNACDEHAETYDDAMAW